MYNEALSFLEMMEKSLEKRPFVFSISLSRDTPLIGRLEKDPARLRKAAEDGKTAVFLALEEKCGFARGSKDFESFRPFTEKNP
jgi:hypothetical protein